MPGNLIAALPSNRGGWNSLEACCDSLPKGYDRKKCVEMSIKVGAQQDFSVASLIWTTMTGHPGPFAGQLCWQEAGRCRPCCDAVHA